MIYSGICSDSFSDLGASKDGAHANSIFFNGRSLLLSEKKQTVTQQQLADYANTDKMMTSKVLMALEKKQIIERIKDPGDSRAKQLRITGKGIQTLREASYETDKIVIIIIIKTEHYWLIDDQAHLDFSVK